MKLEAYSVYDQATEAWMPPFFVRTRAEAVRMMTDSCADPNHLFSRHSSNFRLYQVGGFDDTSGAVWAEEAPVFVVGAEQLVPGPLFRGQSDQDGRSDRPTGIVASLREGAR